MRRCFAVIVALVLASAVPLLADDPGNPIDHGLWQISGESPTLPQSELEPLRQLIGGAQFVGVGEPIHTSGGFYEMKDRVFRYLVEQMGFRAFGIESNWIRADRVEQYVQTGGETSTAALGNIVLVFRSVELRTMVEWMRAWNVAHPDDRVHFYGFDIQAQSPQNAAALFAILQATGITDDDPRIAGIHVCDGVDHNYYLVGEPYPAELYEQCTDALASVETYFDENEKEIERTTSPEQLAYARIHVVAEQAWQEEIFYFDDSMRSGRARDRGMAYVAQAIRKIRFPHARTMLWAHNGHVAKNGSTNAYFAVDMGTYLTRDLGDQNYVAIGQTARNIYVDWPALRLCGLYDLEEGDEAVERFLGTRVPSGGVIANLDAQPPFLTPGATYTVGSVPMVPREHFDVLLYLTESHAMHYLSGRVCGQ